LCPARAGLWWFAEWSWVVGVDAVSATPGVHVGDEPGEFGDIEVCESAGNGAAVEIADEPGCTPAGIGGVA
jgi:hypothetical protein